MRRSLFVFFLFFLSSVNTISSSQGVCSSCSEYTLEVKVAWSCPTLCTPMDYTVPEFSRSGYWSGQSFPSPGDLPNSGLNLGLQHCRRILYQLSHKGIYLEKKAHIAFNFGIASLCLIHGVFPVLQVILFCSLPIESSSLTLLILPTLLSLPTENEASSLASMRPPSVSIFQIPLASTVPEGTQPHGSSWVLIFSEQASLKSIR